VAKNHYIKEAAGPAGGHLNKGLFAGTWVMSKNISHHKSPPQVKSFDTPCPKSTENTYFLMKSPSFKAVTSQAGQDKLAVV